MTENNENNVSPVQSEYDLLRDFVVSAWDREEIEEAEALALIQALDTLAPTAARD